MGGLGVGDVSQLHARHRTKRADGSSGPPKLPRMGDWTRALTAESPPATRRGSCARARVGCRRRGRARRAQRALRVPPRRAVPAGGRAPSALGYVDQPPLAPLVARGITAVVGEHLWALRLVSGAAHAGLVVAVAGIAPALGGRPWTLLLAALAAATMPVFVAAGARFDPGSLGLLLWALALWAVASVLAGSDPAGGSVRALLGATLAPTWTGPLLALGLVLGLVLALGPAPPAQRLAGTGPAGGAGRGCPTWRGRRSMAGRASCTRRPSPWGGRAGRLRDPPDRAGRPCGGGVGRGWGGPGDARHGAPWRSRRWSSPPGWRSWAPGPRTWASPTWP